MNIQKRPKVMCVFGSISGMRVSDWGDPVLVKKTPKFLPVEDRIYTGKSRVDVEVYHRKLFRFEPGPLTVLYVLEGHTKDEAFQELIKCYWDTKHFRIAKMAIQIKGK